MTAILDFIHSNPLHTSFRFTSDQIENFLAALIDKEVGNFRMIVTENR